MLTARQLRLYEYLLDQKKLVSAKTISKEVPGYKSANPRTAISNVGRDVADLVEAYAFGDLDYLVIGLNSHGYKIGNEKETWGYISRRWKSIIRGLRVVKAIANKAGLDGQLAFTEEGIEELETVRKGEHE